MTEPPDEGGVEGGARHGEPSPAPDDLEAFGAEIEGHLRQTRLAALFLQAPAFMAVTRGGEHVFVNANPTYYDLVGDRELIGRPVREAFPELEGEGYFEALDRVYRTGEPFVGSEQSVALRGEEGDTRDVWVCFAFHPLVEEDGSTGGVLVHGIDVTERVTARQSLRRRARQQSAVARLGREAIRSRSLPALLQSSLTAAAEATEAPRGEVLEAVGDGRFRVRAASGWTERPERTATLAFEADAPPGRVVAAGEPRRSEGDVSSWAEGFPASSDRSEQLSVPVGRADDVWGVLLLHAGPSGEFDDQDLHFAESVAHVLTEAIRERESERFVDTIARNLPGMLYRCRNDRNWTMEYLSQGTRDVTGYRPEELLHNERVAYADLIHPDDREDVWEDVQAAVGEDRPFQLQYRIRPRDGEVRWVWEQGRGVRPETGDGLVLEGCIFDITDWRRARGESEIAYSLLSATVESISDAIFVVKLPERRIEFCNPAAEEMFGYSAEEMLGASTERLHEDRASYERFDRLGEDALESRGVFRGEFRMCRADGSTFPSEHVVSLVRPPGKEDGDPGYAVSVIRDVTDRVRREEGLRLVNELSRAITRATDLREALETVLAGIGEHAGWRCGEAWIPAPRHGVDRDGDRLDLASVWTAGAEEQSDRTSLSNFIAESWSEHFRPGEGLPGRTWTSGEPVLRRDVTAAEGFRRGETARAAGLRSALAVPVSSGGRPVAVLVWYDDLIEEEDGALVELAETVAGRLGAFLARQEVEESLRRSEAKFATAFHVNPMAMSISTLEEGRFLEVNQGFREVTGYEPEEVVGRTAAEVGLWDEAHDREEVVRRIRAQDAVRDFETRLRTSGGEIRHVLYSGHEIEVEGTACLLSAAQDITRRKRFEEELEHQALHDGLTGLPNRSLLRDRLEHALDRAGRTGDELALVFLDLDRFKAVNDTLGHPAGDELLRTVAGRLEDAVRDQDTVARYGGDEFALIFEGMDSYDDVRAAADRVSAVFEEPCVAGDSEVHPSASIGIALSEPDVRDPDDLIRHADIAMYRAKSPDRTEIHVYDPEADIQLSEQFRHENELRRAVAEDEFVLYYQPVLDLESGQVVAAEALVRWQHPEAGLVPPGDFIGLAEETGLIVPIGQLVLERAVRTAARWLEGRVSARSPFRVGVNLSARQYQEAELADRIRAVAEEHRFPMERLMVEITESVLMRASGRLAALREDGLTVAIDDFGTGYSSLQYLRRLEADVLKIDRGFVEDLEAEGRESVIVQAILMMARQFGMDVVAEGVETKAQVEHLTALGCHYAQGFYFARPVPAEAFEEEWLAG